MRKANYEKIAQMLADEKHWVPAETNTLDFKLEVYHLDGIPWFMAQLPNRFHSCKPQTIGYINYFDYVERCACGAIRLRSHGHDWSSKNDRRKNGAEVH